MPHARSRRPSVAGNAPFAPDVLLRSLDAHGVRYVLIGGLAAVAHGSELRTADVDITPAPDEDNRERLVQALRSIDAQLRVPGGALPFELRARDLHATT